MDNEQATRVISVTGCARCGGKHTHLLFWELKRPVIDNDGTTWRWWATCPETGDPVLMKVIEKDNVNGLKA